MEKGWVANAIDYFGEKRIQVKVPDTPHDNMQIKQIKHARWSRILQSWHVPDTPKNRKLLGIDAESQDVFREDIDEFRKWMVVRNYSEDTIQVYSDVLKTFFRFFPTVSVSEITETHYLDYCYNYLKKNNLSISYQNQLVNALKLFYAERYNRKINLEKVIRPLREKVLPKVFSTEEISKLLSVCQNMKHLAMLSIIYSAGLRAGDMLKLKWIHISRERLEIRIEGGKGKKDRIVPLAASMIPLLEEYWQIYKSKEYVFEGQKGEPYSYRSLQMVFKKCLQKAGIEKPFTLHSLRHSYATHLLESGTNLRYIQEILGHNSPKTTEIYTHVMRDSLRKIVSPLDKLNLDLTKISSNNPEK